MGVVEELIRAREAYDRREWLAAYSGLSDVAQDELTPAAGQGSVRRAARVPARPPQ